jgi:hypothetical protein
MIALDPEQFPNMPFLEALKYMKAAEGTILQLGLQGKSNILICSADNKFEHKRGTLFFKNWKRYAFWLPPSHQDLDCLRARVRRAQGPRAADRRRQPIPHAVTMLS